MLLFSPTCSAVINGGNIACNMQVHLKREILLFKEGTVSAFSGAASKAELKFLMKYGSLRGHHA